MVIKAIQFHELTRKFVLTVEYWRLKYRELITYNLQLTLRYFSYCAAGNSIESDTFTFGIEIRRAVFINITI